MDITEFVGNSVTVEVVKASPTKSLVILSGGALKDYEGKKKLCMLVEMDGKQISYTPNKTSLRAIAAKYGNESTAWIGKPIMLAIGSINGKEAVIASPQ